MQCERTFWTRTITGNTFSVNRFLSGRAVPDARTEVLEQMLRTVLDTCSSIGILPFRVSLPRVRDRIIPVHRWAFLFAYAVIIEVLTGKAVRLFGSDTAARAEQVTAFPWVRAEAASLVALRRAIDLRELLAVVSTFTPATTFAGGIASWTLAFWVSEIILVHHLELGTGEDLFPVDVAHMAKVIIIEEAD